MKIAFIVPSLANKGPVLVVKDIVAALVSRPDVQVKVFYFDDICEVAMEAPAARIAFDKPLDFGAFDVVHSHGLRPNKYVTRYRADIPGVCVATMHSNIYEEYRNNYNRFVAFGVVQLWRRYLTSQDIVISLSMQMQEFYKKLLPRQRHAVIYNGRVLPGPATIDPADLELIARLKAQYRVLGAACILTHRKGIHQVVRALPQLPGFALLVIGDGPEKMRLTHLAARLGVADRCIFLGQRPMANRFFPYFDQYVMSSYSEGLPLSLLEAAASGIPAVCSDIPLFRELFTREQVGFFTLDNTGSLVSAVEQVQADHKGSAVRLHEKYLTTFTAEKMGAAHYDLFKQAIRSGK